MKVSGFCDWLRVDLQVRLRRLPSVVENPASRVAEPSGYKAPFFISIGEPLNELLTVGRREFGVSNGNLSGLGSIRSEIHSKANTINSGKSNI